MAKLGLGVLGLGEGRSIISAAQASDLYDVAGLCDLNADLGQARLHEFGLNAKLYTDSYAKLLANPKVDVVGIYTPDQLHAEHVIQALNAGKHVVSTKPFLNDLSRGKEVLDAQRNSGKRVFVGQSTRFFAGFKRQHEHFKTGAFGELYTIEAAYHADHRWFLEKGWALKPDFKWLYACISHPADLIRWYMPDIKVVSGYATLSPVGKQWGLAHPDTFHFALKATDGRIARVSGSYSTPLPPEQRESGLTCILRATEGASQADYWQLRYNWRIGDKVITENFEHLDEHHFRFEGHSHHAGEYQNYLEYFARSLGEGSPPAKPDVEEGLGTMALMQAMEEAHLTEQPVKIADVLQRYGLGELAQSA